MYRYNLIAIGRVAPHNNRNCGYHREALLRWNRLYIRCNDLLKKAFIAFGLPAGKKPATPANRPVLPAACKAKNANFGPPKCPC